MTEINLLLDTIVFIAFLVVAVIFIFYWKKKFSLGFHFTSFLLIYIFMSYSSFNIMIKPIHDFNLVVPRTFLFHYKAISTLSISDLFFMAGFLFIVIKKFAANKLFNFSFPQETYFLQSITIQKGMLLGGLSFLALFVYVIDGNKGNISTQFSLLRGFFSFTVLGYFYYYSLKDIKKIGFIQIFYIFCILDLLNVFSGFISSLIFYDYVWERYGFKITVIDQDNALFFLLPYAVILSSMLFSRTTNKKMIWISCFIIGFFVIINMYKAVFGVMALFVIYEFFVNLFKGRFLFFKLSVLIILIVPIFEYVQDFSESKAMNTRNIQFSEYWEYTGSNFPYYLIGIGSAGYYYSPTDSDDGGEIKEIDLENNDPNFRRDIQTQFLSDIKKTGIIGFIFVVIFNLFIIARLLWDNIKLPHNVLFSAIIFCLIWFIATNNLLFEFSYIPNMEFYKLLIFYLAIKLTTYK